MLVASLDEINALAGQELAPSSWVLVDQNRIDQFAAATGDYQFIHVDPERAALTPFGGTIAHGLLTLQILAVLVTEIIPYPPGLILGVNYGYNKIRFIAPLRVGRRFRGRFMLTGLKELKPGRWQYVMDISAEIEGEAKPALVAEWIILVDIGIGG